MIIEPNNVDRLGRRVNKRGYLIDQKGNVIIYRKNKTSGIIFNYDELENDGEIPEPFYSQKQCNIRKIIKKGSPKKSSTKKNNYKVDLSDEEDFTSHFYKGKRSNLTRMTNESDEEYMKRVVRPIEPKSKEEIMKKGRNHVISSGMGISSQFE